MIELLLVFKIFEASIEYLSSQNQMENSKELIEKQRGYTKAYIFNLILIIVSLIFNINFLSIISTLMALGLRIYIIVEINNLKKMNKEPIEE